MWAFNIFYLVMHLFYMHTKIMICWKYEATVDAILFSLDKLVLRADLDFVSLNMCRYKCRIEIFYLSMYKFHVCIKDVFSRAYISTLVASEVSYLIMHCLYMSFKYVLCRANTR